MRELIDLAYLAAAVLFILGLKRMSSPATARSGNLLGAIGMLIAILATLAERHVTAYTWIAVGLAAGAAAGVVLAKRVQMTAMPQMVALLNGSGGGASLIVAIAAYCADQPEIPAETGVSINLSVLIGAITLTGSLVAFAKLQELVSGKPVLFPLQKSLNLLLGVFAVAAVVILTVAPDQTLLFAALGIIALALGVLLVIPIGGADMPVVISLLNSYSGVAAAMTGFVIQNSGLIISGALVGASGIILTRIMCKAMNRSLANVLFGGFGATPAGAAAKGPGDDATVREVTVDDAATMMAYARTVIIVPGYGLAVAQAQHVVRELADLLAARGVDVKYAIHPVAGRMPGHMNVLLAEADVPYPQLHDMDAINPEMERADVALVIGANDVVNPAARNDPASPIYGMPILDVDKAKHAIVLKRGMSAGFAGIENALFTMPRTSMLFGDAKASLTKLVAAVSETE
jgi:NAD(P) transhydrogenase subunit beta